MDIKEGKGIQRSEKKKEVRGVGRGSIIHSRVHITIFNIEEETVLDILEDDGEGHFVQDIYVENFEDS